ncbi:hypothetical protein GGI07_003331 [Coemansia sp. Benny D115]|nr:hypothetical protein GGI07_003331 [Coemansia sp. Benny D115]
MNFTEREEDFREMAALGNLKAIMAFLRGGINIDHQNKMNGWTALHWACARNNISVIELLIRAGANLSIENNKGERPIDVCKTTEARDLFKAYMGKDADQAADSSKQQPSVSPLQKVDGSDFVPNYLTNPDLSKAWGMPDSALLPSQGDSGYMRQMQYEASVSTKSTSAAHQPVPEKAVETHAAVASSSHNLSSNEEREILVYREQVADDTLLGSIFVNAQSQTVTELAGQIREELDCLPDDFAIARFNGKQTVPVGAKQEEFSVGKVFRGADDAVVLKTKSN